MTIGFYYHDRMRRSVRGHGERHGPFWLTLKRNHWKFLLGEWVGMPAQLQRRFRHHLAKVKAVGREGFNVIVHLSSA